MIAGSSSGRAPYDMRLLTLAFIACAADPDAKGHRNPGPTEGTSSPEDTDVPLETTPPPPCDDGTASLALRVVNIVGDTPIEEYAMSLQYILVVTVDGTVLHDGPRTEDSFVLPGIPTGEVEIELTNGGYQDAVTTSGSTSYSYGLNGTCYTDCTASASVEVCDGDEAAVDLPLDCASSYGCD